MTAGGRAEVSRRGEEKMGQRLDGKVVTTLSIESRRGGMEVMDEWSE